MAAEPEDRCPDKCPSALHSWCALTPSPLFAIASPPRVRTAAPHCESASPPCCTRPSWRWILSYPESCPELPSKAASADKAAAHGLRVVVRSAFQSDIVTKEQSPATAERKGPAVPARARARRSASPTAAGLHLLSHSH